MTVVNAWVGAVTPNTARVVAKIDGTNAELFVADNAAMDDAVSFGAVAADADDIADLAATGLDPDTHYWWQIEVDTVADVSTTGRFRTHPPAGQPTDFTFWAAGDAGLNADTPGTGTVLAANRLSNHAVFETLTDRTAAENWLFGVHLGDLHYYDLGSGNHGIGNEASADQYRRAYDDVLLQPRQHTLYRDVPTVILWDDHDYGPNNSDRTSPGRVNARAVYRQRTPHYPLPSTGGIYHSWQVGRVLFIASDVRSDRDPNTTPHSTSKTLLGTAQKNWMRGVLEAETTAEFLVWICPERAWHMPAVASGSSEDHWGNFPHERAELVTMFEQTGWADRMVVISADSHQMAMDSGATNQFGGWPVYQLAPLDCSPDAPTPTGLWDIGTSLQRAQYGTVRISDSGDAITVTATGWIDETQQMQHQFTVQLVEPVPPDGDGGLAQVSQARITTRLTWLSCNLSDGAVITELPDLQGDEVSRVIGEYTSANLKLPIPAVGARDLSLAQKAALAIQSTQPPRTKIVAVVNDVPAWEGIPLPRDLGTDATIPLGCVSMEGYLRHVYISDHTWDGVDVSVIAAGLLSDAVTTPHGPGIALVIDAPPIGMTESRSYLDIDDQTVYSGLSELMDAGLIEWTLSPDWRSGFAYRIVDTIARVRGRLGKSGEPQAVFQSATFSSQGASDARYTLKQDYSGDRYANVVRLAGTGEGADQPRSAPAIDQAQLDSGVPVWELRDSAPQAITGQSALDRHATQRLARVRGGAQVIEVTARWDAPGARYGVDWEMGDDVKLELKGHAHPSGLDVVRRAIGFHLSIQGGTIRPVLQEEL